MPLDNHLKEYRARFSLSQERLGELTGVSRQTISLIERGIDVPSVILALKIAKALEAKVEDLFQYKAE
ncbi:transcriptional regulator [bacterium 1XD42-8]|jgi:putative transcriptional regulator|nr:helix-turn-helix transcriptional regulator [Lachnospiraceae bacterium]RKJ40039.1 transcriptional regulator [bacterium 1XD42-8]